MPATLAKQDDIFTLDLSDCSRSEFSDTLAKIQAVPGSRFNWDDKMWEMPAEARILQRVILSINPTCDPALIQWGEEQQKQMEHELVTKLPDDGQVLVPWGNKRMPWQPEFINELKFEGLKSHQRAFIEAAIKNGKGVSSPLRVLLADDMGLAKTSTCLSLVVEAALLASRAKVSHTNELQLYLGPKLVVCPNSVKGVWAREVKRFLGPLEPAYIIDGTTLKARMNQLAESIADKAWTIVNYEQLRIKKVVRETRTGGKKTEWVLKEPVFGSTPWDVVIADEAHRAKNRKSLTARGLYRIQAPIMIAATGTPLMNSPDELWSLLHWLYPEQYKSYWAFYESYVDYTEGFRGKVIVGVKNPDGLRFELHEKMYRRTKDQVLDLPEKLRIIVPIKLDKKQQDLYNEAERGLWLEVEKAIQEGDKSAARLAEAAASGVNIYSIPNGAARTVRLRQVLSTPALLGGDDTSAKLDAAVDSICDNRYRQHVVFSEFVGTCAALEERLTKQGLVVGVYTGETPQPTRTKLEDDFQKGQIDVMVGTIGAMREGITLTAADTVHFIERAWVPGWNEQAEDRCHRIGQDNTVTIYIYEAENTVDDNKVKPTNRLKERIVSSVLPKDTIKEVIQ